MRRRLRARGIDISVSKLGSTRFDMQLRGLSSVCRASLRDYDTETELERFCDAL